MIVRPVQQDLDLFPGQETQLVWSPAFLAQTCLPYSELSSGDLVNGAYVRKNGNLTMRVFSPFGASGIPYGKFPRQFLIWLGNVMVYRPDLIDEEWLRIKMPFRSFCKEVGIDSSRGVRGSGRGFVEQMRRLMTCDFLMAWETQTKTTEKTVKRSQILKFSVSTAMDISWVEGEDRPREWLDGPQSGFRLSKDFISHMRDNRMALNPDHVAVLCKGKSPLRLDTYLFLAYRNYGLVSSGHQQAPVTWDQLMGQFGSLMDRSEFIRTFRREAAFIRDNLWPELSVSVDLPNGLVLHRSPHPTKIPKFPFHPVALPPYRRPLALL